MSRRATEVVSRLMTEEPVVAIQGPRSAGKSTMLRAIAKRLKVEVFDLDDLATRDAVLADPISIAASKGPVCIDEYQHVPDLLDAIKAELNRDLRPGRFVITGSTRHDALPAAAQALTGRLHIFTLFPFSQGEIAGTKESLVGRLVEDPDAAVRAAVRRPLSVARREDYVERVVTGGFPLAVARATRARARWFDDYVRLSLERDVRELSRVRQRAQMPRLLAALAGQTAQTLNMAKAASRTGIEVRTGENYVKLLEAVFLVHRLPAWGTTLRARAVARPKVHMLDSGLAARLLRLSPERLARLDATSQTQFGHLLETFAVGEILKQLSWVDAVADCGHWRTGDGDEVDLIVELGDGSILAFEIKAGRRVAGSDFTAMGKLRSLLGDRFAAGVVLYLGERSYVYDDRLSVMPLDRLWTPFA
jgi:uncharacterized protein